jgi:YHS domain-containing protein
MMLGALVLLAAVSAQAADKPQVNSSRKRVAVDGTDVVAYFTDAKPAKGREEFQHEWNGAVWRFASAEHRDQFAAEPAKYAPQFGGYCAWAVSQGYTADIDPRAWKIVNGKLYLNYSTGVQEKWERDRTENILRAERNWPAVLKK